MAIKLIRHGNVGLRLDHESLENRESPDQHPVEAITGLADQLNLINQAQVATYHFKDLNDTEEIVHKGNFIEYDGMHYLRASSSATRRELFKNDSVYDSSDNSYTKENSLIKLEYNTDLVDEDDVHETDREKALSIFEDTSNPDKINYRNILHRGWRQSGGTYIYNHENKDVISVEYTMPTYVDNILFSVSGVEGVLRVTCFDGTIKELQINEDQSSTQVHDFIVKHYVKSIVFRTSLNRRPTSEGLPETCYRLLQIFSASMFEGFIRGEIFIGTPVLDSIQIEKRNMVGDDLLSVSNRIYRKEIHQTVIDFRLSSHSPHPIPIHDILIRYRTQASLTAFFLAEQNREIYKHLDSIVDYQGDIDKINKALERKRKDIDHVTTNVVDAHSVPDIFGQNYPDLKSRLDYIEGVANKSLIDKNESIETHENLRQMFVITEPQQELDLDFEYPVGKYQLKVFLDGLKAEPGENDDYIEVNETSIRFNYPLEPGQEVVCEVNSSVGLKEKIVNTKYFYDDSDRLIREEITGDEIKVINYEYRENNEVMKTITTPSNTYSTLSKYNEKGLLEETINEYKTFIGERYLMAPRIVKIRRSIIIEKYQSVMLNIPTGVGNNIEIKSIFVGSDDGLFNIEITDKKEDGFVCYKTENTSSTHEIVPIVYSDEDNTGRVHLEINNLLGREYEITIRIDGTELRSI